MCFTGRLGCRARPGVSGTYRGWLATAVVLLGFVLGGTGLTFGPRVLLWIGIGVIVAGGGAGLFTHAWSDFRRKR